MSAQSYAISEAFSYVETEWCSVDSKSAIQHIAGCKYLGIANGAFH